MSAPPSSPAFVSLDLSKNSLLDPPSDDNTNLQSLSLAFERDGFLCLRNLFSPTLIRQLQTAAFDNFERCFRVLHQNGHIVLPESRVVDEGGGGGTKKAVHSETGDVLDLDSCGRTGSIRYPLKCGVKHGFREITARSPGRYEMPYMCDSFPFHQNCVLQNENLLALVRRLMGMDGDGLEFHMCNVSIVMSTPGTADQAWHADGGHVDVLRHRPGHCLNVFVPLVDVTEDMGATEFRPGSHYHTRNLAPMMLAARARKTLRPTCTPLLNMGDALLFDYRILHRGRANVSEHCRPILVMTFAKTWFNDVLNFSKRSMHDCAPPESVEVD